MTKSSLYGLVAALFELPEEPDRYCFSSSADVATAILLTTEVDAATLARRSSDGLVTEFSELTAEILQRCQRTGRAPHLSSPRVRERLRSRKERTAVSVVSCPKARPEFILHAGRLIAAAKRPGVFEAGA